MFSRIFMGHSNYILNIRQKIWNLPHTRKKHWEINSAIAMKNKLKQTRLGVGLEGIAVQVEKLCRENY